MSAVTYCSNVPSGVLTIQTLWEPLWCCQSQEILHLFSSAWDFYKSFFFYHPSVPLLTQSELYIWLDYRTSIGLTLIGSSYLSRLADWIIYTSPNREWWGGQVIKDLFTDSLYKYWLYSTNMDSYILVGQAWKGLLISALGQERTKVDRIIVGGILVKSKLAKCPWIKSASWKQWCCHQIKQNTLILVWDFHSGGNRRFWAYSGSKIRALGDMIGFLGLSQALSEAGQVKTSVSIRVALDSLELSIPKGTLWMIPTMEK